VGAIFSLAPLYVDRLQVSSQPPDGLFKDRRWDGLKDTLLDAVSTFSYLSIFVVNSGHRGNRILRKVAVGVRGSI